MVLITKTHAVVVKINPGKLEVIASKELPKTVDYRNCDSEVLY